MTVFVQVDPAAESPDDLAGRRLSARFSSADGQGIVSTVTQPEVDNALDRAQHEEAFAQFEPWMIHRLI